MPDPNYVYVLSTGTYEQRMVVGVYASVEAAMNADPGDWKQDDDWINDTWVPGQTRWSRRGHEFDGGDIERFELQVGEGPT